NLSQEQKGFSTIVSDTEKQRLLALQKMQQLETYWKEKIAEVQKEFLERSSSTAA
ncbi:unnamed protein product, partial [Amoebophrya sp. A120]